MAGRRARSIALRLALAAALAAIAVVADPASAAPGPGPVHRPRRVVVVSIPRLGWADVVPADMPALASLADQGAAGALSVRSLGRTTGIAEGYTTLGAGNRATAAEQRFASTYARREKVAGRSAVSILRSSGLHPTGKFVVPGVGRIQDHNDGTHQGAEVGALGSAVRGAGWDTVAIGDAEGWADWRGFSGLGVVDRQGSLDDARVLSTTSVAPGAFGVDPERVSRAVRDLTDTRTVALLELGEVARADAAHLEAEDRREAARRADRLVAAATYQLDLTKDLVIVLAPTGPSGRPQPVPFVMAGPGVEPGLVRSATTRRAGYVALTDVAPTILERIGRPIPESMNGTPITVSHDARPGVDRLERMAREIAEVRFVDLVQGKLLSTIPIYFGAWSILVLGVTLLPLGAARRPAMAFVRWTGLVLASVPLVALALGAATARGWGQPAWFAVLFVGAIAVASLAEGIGATWPDRPWLAPAGVAAATWGLYLLDLLSGGDLEFNSALGNSPTQGGRFVGLENRGFGVLAACTLVLACLAVRGLATAPRRPGHRDLRRGLGVAAAIFGVTLVVDGAPSFGADVGGALVLGFVAVVTLWLLAGRALTWAVVGSAALAGLAAVAIFGVYDLSRPAEDRSHLGRFITGDRAARDTVVRKAVSAVSTVWHSSLVWVVVATIALAVIAWFRRRAVVDRAFPRGSTAWVLAVSAAITGVVGAALNDSGVAVPAMMAIVLVPMAAEVLLREDRMVDEPRPVEPHPIELSTEVGPRGHTSVPSSGTGGDS